MNKDFVAAYKKANDGMRPGFMAVSGYDGMHLIYEALKKTGGKTDGDALIEAMKGMKWESPRGPISIDPETRDIVQNVYIRKVEKVDGELYNVEFQTFEAVKDPARRRSDAHGVTLSPRHCGACCGVSTRDGLPCPASTSLGSAQRRGWPGQARHDDVFACAIEVLLRNEPIA
jgi:hypothetical protein